MEGGKRRGAERNGMEWNGMEWNGIDSSGLEWIGVDWSVEIRFVMLNNAGKCLVQVLYYKSYWEGYCSNCGIQSSTGMYFEQVLH